MSTPAETFEIPLQTAEVYESSFVPALFAEWAPHVIDLAGVGAGDAVLDVACGTGIVARTVADRIGPSAVTGVDLNEAMLTVARRVRPDIEYRQGDVGSLPFPDAAFDAVLCQMALMFFPDRGKALEEMARVARPDGTIAVMVPADLPSQPAYGPFVELAARHAGPEALSILSTYWSCGDMGELTSLVEASGLTVVGTRTRTGTARFSSVDAFVTTEVESTPLIDRLDDEAYQRIRAGVAEIFSPWTDAGGAVAIPLAGHIVAAQPGPA